MAKSRDAFRTISEVSDVLDTPAHVLRFWESKFNQIKPVKRAGGRRYYRPDDVSLLLGIKTLLHDQGMTIKGAQKLLREQGVKHVMAIGDGLDAPEQTMAPTLVTTAPDTTAQAVTEMMDADDATQTELFDAPANVEDAPQKPRLQIISAKPVPEDPPALEIKSVQPANPIADLSPFSKPKPTLPANPAPRADMPARCLAAAVHAKPDRVQHNAAKIAPLLTRLTAMRDEMRHPW